LGVLPHATLIMKNVSINNVILIIIINNNYNIFYVETLGTPATNTTSASTTGKL